MFRTVESLTIVNNPIINDTSAMLFRGIVVAAFPNLKNFNGLAISEEERQNVAASFGKLFMTDIPFMTPNVIRESSIGENMSGTKNKF